MRIFVAGIGPGSREDITPAVMDAVSASDVIVGYKYYFQFITPYLSAALATFNVPKTLFLTASFGEVSINGTCL